MDERARSAHEGLRVPRLALILGHDRVRELYRLVPATREEKMSGKRGPRIAHPLLIAEALAHADALLPQLQSLRIVPLDEPVHGVVVESPARLGRVDRQRDLDAALDVLDRPGTVSQLVLRKRDVVECVRPDLLELQLLS